MLCTPFHAFFKLILSDGDFDLPQHLFRGLADRRSQLRYRFQRIEVKDAQKIFMLKIVLRLQAAAGHKSVGSADGGGVSELRSDVEVIILFQKAAVNDVKQFPLMVLPILRRQRGSDLLQLLSKTILAGSAKPLLQGGGNCLLMFRAVLPQPGTAGIFPLAGVRYIKHIADTVLLPAGVHQGDTLGPPHDIPAHLLIPEVVIGAGGGIRPLGVNEQLVTERVFI
jgi:hypothetical protein